MLERVRPPSKSDIPTINKKLRKKLGVSATTTGEVGAVNTSISPYN